MRAVVAASALALVVLAASDAHAGTTSLLSSIATLPPAVALKTSPAAQAVPGLTVKTKPNPDGTKWHDLVASTRQGYCFAVKDMGYRWSALQSSGTGLSDEDLDLHRLTEKDGTATFERTRLHFDAPTGTLTVTGRSHVDLKEVARTRSGLVVWAFREDRAIVVIARHIDGGTESRQLADERIPWFVANEGCPFAGGRLDARDPNTGASMILSGALPAEGNGKEKVAARFIVDASLSRVARDPEPLLAVRVRMVE